MSKQRTCELKNINFVFYVDDLKHHHVQLTLCRFQIMMMMNRTAYAVQISNHDDDEPYSLRCADFKS